MGGPLTGPGQPAAPASSSRAPRCGWPPPAGLRAGAPDSRGPGRRAAHRGRGVRGERGPGLALLPGPHRPQRGDVRAARARLRVLHLRHALLRQPGLRAGGHGRRGAAAGGPDHRGGVPRRRAPAGRPPGGRACPTGTWPAGPPGCARPSASTAPRTARTCATPPHRCGSAPGHARAPPLAPGQPRPAGRGEQRRRPALAFLADRRSHGLGLPACTPRGPGRNQFHPRPRKVAP